MDPGGMWVDLILIGTTESFCYYRISYSDLLIFLCDLVTNSMRIETAQQCLASLCLVEHYEPFVPGLEEKNYCNAHTNW